MMYVLLIKQFLRSKTVLLASVILMLLGVLSISTGQQFLDQKQNAIEKTLVEHQKHIETQTRLHKDDIGLLMYYVKFSFINTINSLAGMSIGQSDLNSHIQNVSLLNLEGQKYDTDLVNPMRLQVGNLDISFLIVFLFPLIIIALSFNLLSEEVEHGTWKMIQIQGKNPFSFILMKLSIRVVFVGLILALLFFVAAFSLNISLDHDFINIIVISYAYLIFWFAVCFFIIVLNTSSNTNAIVLLSVWLGLVVFLPMVINNYVVNKYPIGEALSMTIKQRDAYHKKWDTDKKKTLEQFYQLYPKFSKYGIKDEGFSWLWYYAMQHMGDEGSKEERLAMYEKIRNRDSLSKQLALFIPSLQVQLSMNASAQTSLANHLSFLDATTAFHEDIRLKFYPKIFKNEAVSTINWNQHKPHYYTTKVPFNITGSLWSILLFSIVLICFGIFKGLKL